MNSQERVIRPFASLDSVEQALASVWVQVGETHVETDRAASLSAERFLTSVIALRFARTESDLAAFREALIGGVQKVGMAEDDVCLTAVASTSRLKLAEIVWELPLSSINRLPSTVVIGDAVDRPAPLSAPSGGCRIDVYVRLSRELPPAPLSPWRLGTWLARASFEIRTDLAEHALSPIPLTDKLRADLGLPHGVLRYIEIDDPLCEAFDALRVYVDGDLLFQMSNEPSTAGARHFQRQLYLDVITSLVYEFNGKPDSGRTFAEVQGTLIERLVMSVAGSPSLEFDEAYSDRCSRVFDLLRHDPRRFLALLESALPTKSVKDDLSAVLASRANA